MAWPKVLTLATGLITRSMMCLRGDEGGGGTGGRGRADTLGQRCLDASQEWAPSCAPPTSLQLSSPTGPCRLTTPPAAPPATLAFCARNVLDQLHAGFFHGGAPRGSTGAFRSRASTCDPPAMPQQYGSVHSRGWSVPLCPSVALDHEVDERDRPGGHLPPPTPRPKAQLHAAGRDVAQARMAGWRCSLVK